MCKKDQSITNTRVVFRNKVGRGEIPSSGGFANSYLPPPRFTEKNMIKLFFLFLFFTFLSIFLAYLSLCSFLPPFHDGGKKIKKISFFYSFFRGNKLWWGGGCPPNYVPTFFLIEMINNIE